MNDDLFAKHSWSLDLFALRRQYKFGRCHMLWSKVGSFSLKREESPRSVNWGDIYYSNIHIYYIYIYNSHGECIA